VPRRWRRRLAWGVAVVAFAVAATYVIGGQELVRQLIRRSREVRAQAATALQPPTQAEMQRVVTDTARAGSQEFSGTPVSIGLVASWIGSVMIVVVAMFYLTGRAPRKRRD